MKRGVIGFILTVSIILGWFFALHYYPPKGNVEVHSVKVVGDTAPNSDFWWPVIIEGKEVARIRLSVAIVEAE